MKWRLERLGRIVAVVVATAPATALASCNLDLQPYTDPVDAAAGPTPTSPSTGAPTGDPTHPVEAGAGPPDASKDGQADAGPVMLPTKKVFVSSATVPGNFNGAAGADSFCNALAEDAKLSGTFIAWVSTRQATAPKRLTANARWAMVDGTVVFPSNAALKTGPTSAIHLDELSRDVGGIVVVGPTTLVWTGTTNAGESSVNCTDFTGQNGTGLAGDATDAKKWTESGPNDCAASLHVYCFEQ